MPYLVGIPVVAFIISCVLNVILAMLLVLTYSSLTQENLVAEITFDKLKGQEKLYTAHVLSPSGSKIGDYLIYGDQWRMDAAFIKMEYWANILGVDSKYALNRIEGRYKNIKDENTKEHKSYQLEGHTVIETFSFFVDTTYGSSVYQDIKLGIKYKVLHSPTGLLVREEVIIPEKGYWDKAKDALGF